MTKNWRIRKIYFGVNVYLSMHKSYNNLFIGYLNKTSFELINSRYWKRRIFIRVILLLTETFKIQKRTYEPVWQIHPEGICFGVTAGIENFIRLTGIRDFDPVILLFKGEMKFEINLLCKESLIGLLRVHNMLHFG